MKNTQLLEQLQSLLEQAQENAVENEKPLDFQAAKRFLGVSSSTLYKMTFLKKIPFSKPGGKKLYFLKSDLIKWMRSGAVLSEEQVEEASVSHIMKK